MPSNFSWLYVFACLMVCFQIRGTAYGSSSSAPFFAQLFHCAESHRFVIEIQRRSGCAFLFRDFFSHVTLSLQQLAANFAIQRADAQIGGYGAFVLPPTQDYCFALDSNATAAAKAMETAKAVNAANVTPVLPPLNFSGFQTESLQQPVDLQSFECLVKACNSNFFDLRVESMRYLIYWLVNCISIRICLNCRFSWMVVNSIG